MELIQHDRQFAVNIFALNNTGTLCYLNSLIQALVSCPAFVKTILDYEDEFKSAKDKLGVKLLELINRHIVPVPITAAYSKIKVDTTEPILRDLQSARKGTGHTQTLGTNTQEDVFEGMKLMIESLGDILQPRTQPQVVSVVNNFQDMFNVRYKLIIRCRACGSKRDVGADSCLPDITINMSESNPLLQESLSTQEQVEQYITLHMQYPDDYKCEACSIKNTPTVHKIQQFYTLARVSSIICMSFHDNQQILFQNAQQRTNIARNVRFFPQELRIKAKNGILKYRVVAQIEQSGILGGGHYTAKCLRPRPPGFGALRLSTARTALAEAEKYLVNCHNDERRAQYQNKITNARKVIDEEAVFSKLPDTSFAKQYAVFKFNDAVVTYDPYGIQPSANTYLVFYHLVQDA